MIFQTPNFKNFKEINDFGKHKFIDIEGSESILTTLDGKYHSFNDQPAIIWKDGTKFWLKNGEIHRENDLPAAIYSDGSKEWYINGQLHRDNDLPAIIHIKENNGLWREWHKNGQFIKGM
jgi:hypothetical protein